MHRSRGVNPLGPLVYASPLPFYSTVLPSAPLPSALYFVLPIPSSPSPLSSFPFPLFPVAKRPQIQLEGLGSAVSSPSRFLGGSPAAKHSMYILNPESVSGGNDFGSFFVLSNKYKFSPPTFWKCPPENFYTLWAESTMVHDAPAHEFSFPGYSVYFFNFRCLTCCSNM